MGFFHLTPNEWAALRLSLWVAGWAVIGSLPVGIAAAWVLARFRFPGKWLLDGVIHLPLVLPPVVVGYMLLVLLGKQGAIGKILYDLLGIRLVFTWKGAAVAAAVMAFPLLVRAVRLSIEAVDRGLEDAARTLGAGRMRVFFTITLPLIIPGIITGTILAFARSFGEFGATMYMLLNIPGESQTLPMAIYTLTQEPGGDARALRLCVVALVVALAAVIFSEWISRRFTAHVEG